MKLFEQGMFQVDPNATPEMLRKKRERLAAMMPRYGQARYVGEGVGQLFTGIGSGISERRMNKFEGEKSAAATSQFDSFMGGGPMNILGMSQMDASSGTQPASPEQSVADDTMAALGKPSMGGNGFAQGGNQQAFIEAMMPHAMRVSEQTGLDPRIVIAQAAQETGWGKSAPGNNYFGIKSHGKGGGNTFATNEVINGRTVRINDSFRGYGGMGESADGYASFLQENPRYKPMLAAGDLDGQVAALGASGYATDPNYARSVGSIANNIALPDGFTPGQGGNPVTMSTQGQPAQGPSGGADMAGLMQMAANPWLSPEQRQVVNGMLQQAQGQQAAADDRYWKQQDPMYQAQLANEQARAQGGGQALPASIQEAQWRAQEAGLLPGTPEYQSFILNGGGAPVNYRALEMQAIEGGLVKGTPEFQQFMRSRGAGDQSFASTTGTNQANIATGGEAAGAIAEGRATGEGRAADAAALSGNLAQADQAVALIDSVINDPALPGITGMVQGRIMPMTQSGTDLNVKIKQLQGKAFLEAFESLKGGGAITEREGQAATEAMARLDRAQSTEAYVAALTELKTIMQTGAERARAKAGGGAPQPSVPGARRKFNPATGMLE